MNKTGSIYALRDPRSGAIRYVGQTRCPLNKRLSEHIHCPTNRRAREWMRELRDQGLRPEIVLLETVDCADLSSREKFWIKEMHLRREPLTQLADADTLSEMSARGMF